MYGNEFCTDVRFYIEQKHTLWNTMCVSIWFVGVLGNLLNIVIYGQKSMMSPCNSILWWLAVSDLLELLAIASHGWWCKWCPGINMISTEFDYEGPYHGALLLLWSLYLVQVFLTITVGLNIMLAFWRYLAIAHPFQRRFRCDNHSVRKTVLYLYVLSFVSGFSVLYAMKIHESNSEEETIYLVGYRFPGEFVFFGEMCILTYGFILRMVPMLLLAVISIKLIFAVSRSRRAREHLSITETNETEKKMDRINTLILGMLLMFIITEIPIALGTSVMNMVKNIDNVEIVVQLFNCSMMLSYIQKLTLVINCSYSVFFYFIMSTHYRKTFRLLLDNMRHNKRNNTSRHASVMQTEHTDV